MVGQGGILSYCYFISFDFHYLFSLWGVREKWGRKGIWVGRVGKNLGRKSGEEPGRVLERTKHD